MHRNIFWGALLRMIMEGYIIGLISCLCNMRELEFNSDKADNWTVANSVMTMIILPVLGLFPILASCFMLWNHD